jgi:DMSO/TMAO reductase YedYZ molybdopterin-dependent catalytic subunit
MPVVDFLGGKAWIVYAYQGEPLPAVHGGPARLLVAALVFLEVREVGAIH